MKCISEDTVISYTYSSKFSQKQIIANIVSINLILIDRVKSYIGIGLSYINSTLT